MNYSFRKGSVHKVSADIAGKVCEKLERKGKLTAENLVDVSRPENAPLHKEFEWDDTIAGENWRHHQARNLINSLIVVAPETNSEVRKFFNIVVDDRKYEAIETILRESDKREELLRNAVNELKAFERKYSTLSELSDVFAAIDAIKEKAAAMNSD